MRFFGGKVARTEPVLPGAVREVMASGNCSGCGGCAQIWPELTMQIDGSGYSRPSATRAIARDRKREHTFRRVCPGMTVKAPPRGPENHWLFGSYVRAWQAHATDEEVRFSGSSGGVLTALAGYITSVSGGMVIGVGAEPSAPTRSVPVRITSREDALRSSGSRYAPVGVVSSDSLNSAAAVVGKPCEAAAVRALNETRGGDGPMVLSFFCAGTPRQDATIELLRAQGIEPEEVTSLRYRGNGWPGDFVGTAADGREARASYDDSWGKYLGRTLQTRCKICVDGTGELADVAVGDYWQTDSAGYPSFSDAPGSSVLIARTERGARLVERAIADGLIEAVPLDLDLVARIQPLQRDRRRTLYGRLAGRILAGKRIPKYRGFGLARLGVSNAPASARAAVGMWTRSLGLR